MKKYSERLEEMEQSAYKGEWGADWLEQAGECVKFYALKCESEGRRPTFAGLIRFLEREFDGTQAWGREIRHESS